VNFDGKRRQVWGTNWGSCNLFLILGMTRDILATSGCFIIAVVLLC
jgi:hypothetical protein